MRRFFRRLLPAPLLSVFLFLMWLVLNQSVSNGHLLLGAVLGLTVPAITASARPLQPRIRRPWLIPGLVIVVLIDITVSCVRVSQVILGGHQRRQHSGFMGIPLDLRDAHGLAVLSAIVNSTPGTVWAELSDDHTVLVLHVLDLRDEQGWIDTIKNRYEKRLIGIFE